MHTNYNSILQPIKARNERLHREILGAAPPGPKERLQELEQQWGPERLRLDYTGTTGLAPNDAKGFADYKNAVYEAENLRRQLSGQSPLRVVTVLGKDSQLRGHGPQLHPPDSPKLRPPSTPNLYDANTAAARERQRQLAPALQGLLGAR